MKIFSPVRMHLWRFKSMGKIRYLELNHRSLVLLSIRDLWKNKQQVTGNLADFWFLLIQTTRELIAYQRVPSFTDTEVTYNVTCTLFRATVRLTPPQNWYLFVHIIEFNYKQRDAYLPRSVKYVTTIHVLGIRNTCTSRRERRQQMPFKNRNHRQRKIILKDIDYYSFMVGVHLDIFK